jgi:transketolase
MDVLVALYLGGILRHDPKHPNWEGRDYVFLSNGHACPALYAILARCGYFPRSELEHLRQLGAGAQGHPKRGALPGIEISSGSLGQGLGMGIGLARSLVLRNKLNRVVVLMSDGEQEEGSTWEAVMLGAKLKLPNLLAIVDKNGMQIDGSTATVMPSLDPLGAKYQAFGWNVLEMDGHNAEVVFSTLNTALASVATGRPTVVISHTRRGYGVSFMEGSPKWHAGKITDEQYAQAIKALGGEA